ncbi:YfhO family protein [Dysgonomonas sp. ZJ279]|uniref:YfhO family protein n=1 Tax=Dysgonomonas sp. ZJ279 TaxID=2709796 RepID=UPI0013EB78D1|nr:YfhO family protein [Dysgonomonas sp. ZJ279]
MTNKEIPLIKVLSHIAAIIVFLAITLIYFSPQLGGKILPQGDVKQYTGGSQELREYYNQEGESSAWTGAMFSGMPAYQIGVWGGSPNFLDYVEKPFKALGSNAGAVFAGMLMAYLLFSLMGLKPVTAALGAIAYSLSSYNIVILEAGHVTKAWAIAYMPLIIAGMMVLFKRKYLLGGLLMALGLALQIKNNHLQITYYTALLCVFIYIGLIIDFIKAKEIKGIFKATAILAIAVVMAAFCNMGNIYSNYEMSKESTRGKSELSTPTTSEKQSSGLDKDYAFAWSYGKAETFSLMIPDIHGGVSGGTLDKSSNLYKELVKQGYGSQVTPKGVQSYTYWGDQPFTQGPVYFGAIICFLFVLGMIVIQDRMKWVLFAATIFFIFLSWGRNFEWFNDFFFYHFPMYNKFRTVSMALVIPALTMIMVAVWGIHEFLTSEIDRKKLTRALYTSAGIVGGLALFFWVAPGFFFNFVSESDAAWKSQMPDWYYNALILDRKELLSSDALRSLIFIILSAAILWIGLRSKTSKQLIAALATFGIAVLVLIDLWSVDKRYLNNDNFVQKTEYQASAFKETVADKAILQDTHPSYRVLNLNNPFQETATSYYHKSIGGYHAAKLKRYQELIDNRLQQEVAFLQNKANNQLNKEIENLNAAQQDGKEVNPLNIAVTIQDSVSPLLGVTTALNLLNAKYVIYHPELPPVVNPYALGNAWFVSEYKLVNNADEEIAAINDMNPHQTAIVDKRFESELTGLTLKVDSTATMELTEYKPNYLKYKTKTSREQLAVLSEIYYANGWQAYIDGTPTSHFRADWTLRAMRIPAGEHEIEFKFEPKGYNNSRMIATASSGILVLLLLIGLGTLFFRKERKDSVV